MAGPDNPYAAAASALANTMREGTSPIAPAPMSGDMGAVRMVPATNPYLSAAQAVGASPLLADVPEAPASPLAPALTTPTAPDLAAATPAAEDPSLIAQQSAIATAAAEDFLNSGVRPDVVAEIRRISREEGLPLPLAAQSYMDAARAQPGTAYRRLLQQNPGLRQLASRGSPYADFMADAAELATVENAFNTVRSTAVGAVRFPTVSVPRGLAELNDIAARNIADALRAVLPDSVMATIDDAGDALVGLQDELGIPILPSEILRRPADVLDGIYTTIDTPAEDRTFTTDVGAALGQFGAQAALYVLSGGQTAVLSTFLASVDEQSQRVQNADAYGTLEGDIGTLGAAGVSALLDQLNLGIIFERVPEQLRNRMFRILASGTSEGATEMLQAISSNLIAQQIYDPESGILDDAAYDGLLGGIVGAFAGALIPGRRGDLRLEDEAELPPEVVQLLQPEGLQTAADQAASAQQNLEVARAAIEASQTFVRDPAAVRELLEAAGDQEVTIPVQEIERLYQEGALTDDDLAYLQIEDEITQQGELSGDVRTTASRVLTLQGEGFANVVEHVRVSPGAPTVAEAREAVSQREADIERLQGVLEQARTTAGEVNTLADTIFDQIRSTRALSRGQSRAAARLMAERYAARAALFEPGTTATSLYERDLVTFEGQQAAPGPAPAPQLDQILEQAQLVDERNRVPELRRSVEELRTYAEEQSSWRDWYDRYQAMLDGMFEQDAGLFRQILAATSQAASVPANVGLAIKAYEQLLAGQPFTGYLPAVIRNLERIRDEVALSGQKIGQYGAAVTGDEEGIAIDRHVAMIMFDTKSPTAAQVELGKQTVRDIAAQLGWAPREVQAALWAANIARAGKEPQSYDTYLIRKADQIRAIRAAFPAPVAGGGRAGVGAGGPADQGAALGGTFEQGPVDNDTSVAGGLTEKSYITTRDIEGATIFPMFADLTDAGSTFDALDGLPIAPTPYLGGPNFPWLKAYRAANIVWAFNKSGVITRVRNKVKALQEQARAAGRSDRVIITMLAMKDDAHTSNEMTINALLRTLDAVVEAGRFPPEQLATAQELITSKAGKADEGYAGLATFPGFGDAKALHDWIRSATFTTRKALAAEMRSAAFQQLPGMFPVERIVREAVDPDYRATQQGDALLAFEIDPDAEDLIIDFDDPAQAGDVPRHPAYRYGMRGNLVGSFSTHIPMEVLYGDLLPEVIARSKPGSSPKFLMERLKTEDGQVVTPEIVREAEVIEGLHDYRVAQAYTAGLSGQWRSSDEPANRGGINPVEFERALIENDASATLTKYTRDDVKAGKRDGSLRVFQLGQERVQDGGLNVWMAVKRGLDYRQEYPGEVTNQLVEQGVLTDNEVALVGVASNELGVSGMATFQVLKGIEEGVTVLDAFKVKSASKPDGLLPTIYATLGFEEVGEIPFDPQYFDEQQLADLRAIWTRQGWDEADGFPAVAIMKWRGDDALRSDATRRFVLEGQAGLGIRGEPDLDQLDATAASILDGDVAGDEGDGVTRAGDGRADPRRYADRARAVSGRARDFVRNVLDADTKAIDALKLPRDLIRRIRETYDVRQTFEQPVQGPQTQSQGAVGAPRGSYTLPTADDPRNLITLTTSADPSTFVHEVGHMFLFQMLRDLADPRLTAEGRVQLEAQISATRSWFASNSEQAYTELQKMAKDARKRATRLAAGPEKDAATLRADRLDGAVQRAKAGGGATYMARVAETFLDRTAAGNDEAAEVVFHEQWARGFEVYLGSGSAPSAELRTVFAKFAQYIAKVYKSLRSLNVRVTPEIADVFDRLLATEDAINEERRGAMYQISPGVLQGATPAEANELRRLASEAETEARTQMAARVQNSLQRKELAKRRTRREQLSNEIAEQVAAEPVYSAINIAKRGVLPTGTKTGTGKIDRAEFVAVFDEATLARMPSGMVSGRVRPDNAIPLGDLATLSGFPDIYSMVEALTNPTPKPEAEVVRERTDAAMRQEFGADFDPETLRAKAVEVAQNDKFQQLQQLQLRILRRLAAEPMTRIARRQAEQLGGPAAAVDQAAVTAAQEEQARARTPQEGVQAALARIRADVQKTANASQRRAQVAARRQTAAIRLGMDPAAITEAAKRYVEKLKVKDATPDRYRQAASRLTAKIERAIAERNYSEAATLMEQRSLNLAVAKEAGAVQSRVEERRRRWRDVTSRSDKRLAQSYSIDWVNAIRVALEPFGLARNTPRNYDPAAALANLKDVEPALFTEIQLALTGYASRAQAAQQANANNPYKDLTVVEITELLDQADRMLANARDSHGLLVEGRRVAFTDIADQVATNVSQRRKVQAQARAQERGRGSQRLRTVRRQLGAFKASLRRVEQWARDFDNGNPRGPLTRFLVRPVMAAVDAYTVARREPQEALAALLRGRADLMRVKPIRAAELDGYVFQTKGELIMALLHTGNASNKRKLLLGGAVDVVTNRRYVWGQEVDGELDTSRWDRFVDRMFAEGVLTKADMDLVQGIWDIFETTKQAAQAAHKQMYGYYFTEIEAEPVSTPVGIYRGGYAPAITDTMMNADGERFEAEEVMSQQSNAAMFPGAEKGFTQSRTEYNQPLDLDLTRIPGHFDRVMKFAYLGPTVRNAARLVTNRAFREAVRPGSPDVLDVAVIPWLQRTVQQRISTAPTSRGWSGVSRVAAAVDRRVGLHIMAGNLVNAAQQITGFPVAAARIPARHLAVAATRWRVNNQSARAYIMQQSPFMEERMLGGMNEASTTLENILKEPGLLNTLQVAANRYGYFAQQLAQNLVDPTVWLAAERHGMEVVYPAAYAEELARTGDEAAADAKARAEVVAYADSVVRDTQGPLQASDISAIEASTPLARLFLKFYSYFNAMGNLLVTEVNVAQNTELRWTGRYGRSFYAYLMIVTVPTIIAEGIAQLARGGFDDLEDEDERDQLMFELLIGSQLKTMAAMVPFAGAVASTAYGIAVTDQVYDDRISLSAGIGVTESTLQNTIRLIAAAADPETDIETRRAIRTTLDALGLALGLPTNWASKPISYAASVIEGESAPEGLFDIVQGALTGKDGTAR
jgi:hypothetical protein